MSLNLLMPSICMHSKPNKKKRAKKSKYYLLTLFLQLGQRTLVMQDREMKSLELK